MASENPCPVDQTEDSDRPMCYRGEPWCSDRCRKVMQGEVKPTEQELRTMSQELIDQFNARKIALPEWS